MLSKKKIMTKQEAREQMKWYRSQMTVEERMRQDQMIFDRLFCDAVWKRIDWFYPFVSYGTEVDTIKMIRYVLGQGEDRHRVRVAVPKVEGREMCFYEITSIDELRPGYHDILEPVTSCPLVIADRGLMLMPGLAFDRMRNRVGYGGGYYDRYLTEHGSESLFTYAVAYDFQIVDELECDEYDIRPQKILLPGQSLE